MALPARGLAPFVLAILGFATLPAGAQVTPGTPEIRAQTVPSVRPRPTATPTDALALSGPIDPEAYRLGPGDVFVVSIGGGSLSSLRQTEATVSADGLLVISEAGTFQAAGRTLAAVRAEARAALQSRYRNVPADVVLAIPRRFSVYVSGAVPLPGRQALTALGRVEDAVTATTGDLNPLDLADYTTPPQFDVERRVALRNVRVTSRDGTATTVDLYRYYTTGDLAFNPQLTDGDAVFVPTFDPIREGVSVGGDVDRPGYYDWRPDDTVAALVAVAGGPGLQLAGATVRRTRTVDGESESVEVPLSDAASLDIRPRDRVAVRAAAPDAAYASAVGAVAFPGAYPIRSGVTTLQELVRASGGLTENALIRGAYIERSARSEPEAALDALAIPTDRPRTIASFDSTVTLLGRLSDLGLVGRRYYLQEYASTPRLSVDVPGALMGGPPIVLQRGDRLVIPRDLGAIRVFGQVGDPGYVPFQDGLTAADYVDRAGGQGPAATTIYTVDARTGRFTPGPSTPVYAGDEVFVDRPPTSDSPTVESLAIQEQREEREANRDRRQLLIQTITTTISAISTLIFAYSVATRE